MNQVVLSGILRKLDVKYTEGGLAVVRVVLAGEKKGDRPRPYYLEVVGFGDRAAEQADGLKEGEGVLIGGSLRQNEGKPPFVLAREVYPLAEYEPGEDPKGRPWEVGGLNLFQGIGKVVSEPEWREIPGGGVYAFRVRFPAGRKREGMEYPPSVFLGVKVFDRALSLRRGDRVYVRGVLSGRSWTREDGTKAFTLEVIAEEVRTVSFAPLEGSFPEAEEVF